MKDDDSAQLSTTEDFSCPQEGCVCVFQRLSSLERHLSFEKCSKSLERQSLLDLAKTQYATYLMEGVGVMPTLKSREHVITSEKRLNIKEGWALKETRKAYRFNDTQRPYLETKFNIGQSSGRKMDPEAVAREMRRSVDSNGKRLFKVSEFLTAQQISSFGLWRNAQLFILWIVTSRHLKRKQIMPQLDKRSYHDRAKCDLNLQISIINRFSAV